jgi:hypothetical protein
VGRSAGPRATTQARLRTPDREAAAVPAPVNGPLSLQRAIGNRATARLLRDTKKPDTTKKAPPAPPVPRKDYVFIMGEDAPRRRGVRHDAFFEAATEYWQVHLPTAKMITDKRNLDAVLTELQKDSGPIGQVIIVSHANEDGTLAFGVDALDNDGHMSVPELREALHPKSGTSLLSSVKNRVDGKTRIHIKGCDIGRTKQMIDLIDEAFGGAGVVDAPTHEQEYGIDPDLEKQARADFRKEIEDAHPKPEPPDPKLKGTDKAKAKRDYDKAVRDRKAAIDAELKTRAKEGVERAIRASHYEAFSGPMFQHKGAALFTTAELRKEVDRLYPHLSEKRRQQLAEALTRMDTGTGLDQHGQRMIKRDGMVFSFPEITTVSEATAMFGKDFRKEKFTPKKVVNKRVPEKGGGFTVHTVVEGSTPDDPDAKREFDGTDPVPGDADMLAQAKGKVPNPDAYDWRIDETHTGGQTVRKAIAERVVTYLHHESLNVDPHTPFTRPLTDRDFYATSTFGDKPPPSPKAAPAAAAPQKVKRQVLQRKPLPPRKASGLKLSGPTGAYVQAAVDFYGDPHNADKSLAAYAAFLHTKSNEALSAVGVPATKPDYDTNAAFIAQFDAEKWKVTMNPSNFPQRELSYTRKPITTVTQLNGDEAAAAAGTIFHEVRHAEQHFRIARVGAARLAPGAKPTGKLAALDPKAYAEAAKQKLADNAANADLIAEADEWAATAVGRFDQYAYNVDEWATEAGRSTRIGIDPMHSDVAQHRLAAVIAAWRGPSRMGFVKAQLRSLSGKSKPDAVDSVVLSNLKMIVKTMDKVDAGWKKVEKDFDKAGLKARLTMLQDFQHLLYELGGVLDAAYHEHPHEADAFQAGDEVARQFLSIVNT